MGLLFLDFDVVDYLSCGKLFNYTTCAFRKQQHRKMCKDVDRSDDKIATRHQKMYFMNKEVNIQ